MTSQHIISLDEKDVYNIQSLGEEIQHILCTAHANKCHIILRSPDLELPFQSLHEQLLKFITDRKPSPESRRLMSRRSVINCQLTGGRGIVLYEAQAGARCCG